MQFCIDKMQAMDAALVTKIIQRWRTEEHPNLCRYFDYYMGNQAILRKHYKDPSKPCNHIVTNYCDNIVNNYTGYITGLPVTYKSQADMTEVQEVLRYNDVKTKDSELLRLALIYGKAYELHYIDEDGMERFDVLDTRDGIPVYDNTVERMLLYFIRFYPENTLREDSDYLVDVYTGSTIEHYRSDSGWSTVTPLASEAHSFGQVPVTVFSLNADEIPVFYKVMGLQDAYNTLLSGEIDDFEAFCDAYLVLNGADADEEQIAEMKENRVLILPEGASAMYLTKNISDTQIQNILQNLNDTIHKLANSPDFSQESFGVSSGIALRFRLLGFENTASAIAANMTKALQKRIELICAITTIKGAETLWRDMEIVIDRNIPVNDVEAANMVNTLRGLVSDKTLLTQLPFVTDVDAEIEAVQEQKVENIELYGFGEPAGAAESEGDADEQAEQ
nr:MAG TPA: PORTAL PROTEIN [Caudoviricetes sp.]